MIYIDWHFEKILIVLSGLAVFLIIHSAINLWLCFNSLLKRFLNRWIALGWFSDMKKFIKQIPQLSKYFMKKFVQFSIYWNHRKIISFIETRKWSFNIIKAYSKSHIFTITDKVYTQIHKQNSWRWREVIWIAIMNSNTR